jgi:hypothetical protein
MMLASLLPMTGGASVLTLVVGFSSSGTWDVGQEAVLEYLPYVVFEEGIAAAMPSSHPYSPKCLVVWNSQKSARRPRKNMAAWHT